MSESHGNPSDPHGHTPAGPPEPKTPMWLPALGAVLFLTVGILWGLRPAAKGGADVPAAATAGAADAGAAAAKH
jgi:hypothetical protein